MFRRLRLTDELEVELAIQDDRPVCVDAWRGFSAVDIRCHGDVSEEGSN